MGSAVEINLREIDTLARKLNAFVLSGGDKAALLNSLGGIIEDQTKERFDTKRDPDGNAWRKITEKYRKYLLLPKSEKHPVNYTGAEPPLVREGGLRDSIEHQLMGNDAVLIGATAKYADYHQSAKKENRRRKFLGLGANDINELQDEIDNFMKGHIA